MPFNKIKESISGLFGRDEDSDYVEIDLGQEVKKNKVVVRPFVLRKFEDVNDILNSLREGYTIAVVDIAPLKKKDIIELKRSVAKIKKTADALGGDVAGFSDNVVLITPSFAQIHRAPPQPPAEKKPEFF